MTAQTVTIPAGTKLVGELDQQVTSDVNVVVEGRTVIDAGAPLTLRGGDVEVQAVSVNALDGTEIA